MSLYIFKNLNLNYSKFKTNRFLILCWFFSKKLKLKYLISTKLYQIYNKTKIF